MRHTTHSIFFSSPGARDELFFENSAKLKFLFFSVMIWLGAIGYSRSTRVLLPLSFEELLKKVEKFKALLKEDKPYAKHGPTGRVMIDFPPSSEPPRKRHKSDIAGLLSVIQTQEQKVVKIDSADMFIQLIDQMAESKDCDFLCNRDTMLDAYSEGNLYTVCIKETDKLSKEARLRNDLGEFLGSESAMLCLPCFCVVAERARGGNSCTMIWVREDMRRMGIGKLLARELQVTSTTKQIKGSEPFWRSLEL